MTTSLTIVLLAPLVSAVLIALFFRRVSSIAVGLSLIAAASIFAFTLIANSETEGVPFQQSWEWLSFGDFTVSMGFLYDGVAATMLTMVAFVGLLIHIFSLGYMKTDGSKSRFFGGLSIFMFSMIGIVLADNLIMIFVFWELVGFSSYMLIGHYMHTDEAAAASKKAFIVNRIGDLGFLVGIVYAYWHFGTTDLVQIEGMVAADAGLIRTSIAALLMCGFIGKSAQFPLHVWLPDAMAGPTPVSALIHAATMVAAGIYFLIRIDFLFPQDVLNLITWLGTLVAVYAGFCAFGQNDIKRILAYSTLSQLGYMAAVFGLGYPGIALFHLLTHAFFKALLFLGAGSIIHGCHHEQDIFKMGGMLRKMPVTSVLFIIGTLALCGVYGLSGYYSKDAILIAAGLEQPLIFIILCVGALLTAGYMGRLLWIVFFGKPNSDAASHAKESPITMLVPLLLLAILSVVGGWDSFWPNGLGEIIKVDLDEIHHAENYDAMHNTVVLVGLSAVVIGFLLSLAFYGRGTSEDKLNARLSPVYGFLRSRLWFDEIYGFYVAKVQQRVAVFLSFLDTFILKGLIVRGSGGVVGLVGMGVRSLHVKSIHAYVFWFLAGLIGLWLVASGLIKF